MKEEMDRAQAELDALKRTEEDLKKGHQKLEEMVSRLDQEVVRGSFCFCSSVTLFFFFYLKVFLTVASKSEIQIIIRAEKSDRLKMRSKESLMFNSERTRRFDGAGLDLRFKKITTAPDQPEDAAGRRRL